MKRGVTESTIMFLGALTILAFIVYSTWIFITGRQHPTLDVEPKEVGVEENQICLVDNGCDYNPYGSKCIDVNDRNHPERFDKFCGCYINEDCVSTSEVMRGDVCGQNNRCS